MKLHINKEIKKLLKEKQDYFGKDEKHHKLDPVPSFVVNKYVGFLRFRKKESTSEMDCPYYGGTMFSLDLS